MIAEIADTLLAGTGVSHDVMLQRFPGLSYLTVVCSLPGSTTFLSV